MLLLDSDNLFKTLWFVFEYKVMDVPADENPTFPNVLEAHILLEKNHRTINYQAVLENYKKVYKFCENVFWAYFASIVKV